MTHVSAAALSLLGTLPGAFSHLVKRAMALTVRKKTMQITGTAMKKAQRFGFCALAFGVTDQLACKVVVVLSG